MFSPGDHVVDHVDAYLHDLLDPSDAEYVSGHVEVCDICRLALNAARTRFDAMHAVSEVKASEKLIAATEQRIDDYRPSWFTAGRVAAAVAAMLLLTIGSVHLYYDNLSPTPYDLQVLWQSELLADSTSSLRVFLTNPHTQQPISNVPVVVELVDSVANRSVQLASFSTNHWGSGSARVDLPQWKRGEYTLRVQAYPDGGPELITRSIKLRRSWRLLLSTDKPVYQPGQTIHIRCLALARLNGKPTAGQEVIFAISDPKGNRVFRKYDVTSRFGITSVDCPLAKEIIEGIYQIECRTGDTVSRVAVEVKTYVLPKLNVQLDVDQAYYAPGQRVRGEVQADYFFGKAVQGGSVHVEAKAADAVSSTICRIDTTTDASGAAQFEFVLPGVLSGRPEDAGRATIRVTATVRDSAGGQYTRELTRLVAAEPIHIAVIPESGSLVHGVPNKVYFLASYPDGRPAVARLAVSGFHDEIRTDRFGAAEINVTPSDHQLRWIVRATDADGKTGHCETTLVCGTSDGDFLIRLEKTVVDGGESLALVALGGGIEPIFIDLLKDGQTMISDQIEMADGRGEHQVDLPPELSGGVELCAFRFGKGGVPFRKKRALFIRRADELNIHAQCDAEEYRPGDRAKITLTLTDRQGKRARGAVSLSAVDEAVFAVVGRRPGIEDIIEGTSEDVLAPVYAIYPWSSVMSPDASPSERLRCEQAIFSATAREEGDPREVLKRMLGEYVDDADDALRVLERPDWQQMAEDRWMSSEQMELLQRTDSSHTLVANSFGVKAAHVEQQKRRALQTVGMVWKLFFVALLVSSVAGLVHMAGVSWRELILLLVVILILLGLMLPAVQSAREAARRSAAVNRLRQLAMAMDNYHDVHRRFPLSRKPESGMPPGRVRQWFPETLLWRPELITDDAGQVTLELDLADSITTWKLSASAVSEDGMLGADSEPIRVFQPIFVDLDLPVSLTRGDEVTVSAVVYNYLEGDQTVRLRLAEAQWFELLDDAEKQLELGTGEVRRVEFRLRAVKIGTFPLQVDAGAGDASDAIRKDIEVVSDGSRVERVMSGILDPAVQLDLEIPADAIVGSAKAILRLYPSGFSEVVGGLDAVFRRPYGCFEQTSSTTYPNVLALDYLRRTKKTVPGVEAKARQYIHLGYQRLLSFEVAGGGFDWFGRPPADPTLTAYGLMEFSDMARVHDVDANLISRTRNWLLAQRRPDGVWPADERMSNRSGIGISNLATLRTTAYIAWAVYGHGKVDPDADVTLQYLIDHAPEAVQDTYTLALVANALAALRPDSQLSHPYTRLLDRQKQQTGDGKQVWWPAAGDRRTMFYGGGRSASIETTALATLALLHNGRYTETVRKSLRWLVGQKDASGTWHSTQATVLALKALLAGTSQPLGNDEPRHVEIAADGELVRDIRIPKDQSDVVRQVDLSGVVSDGKNRLTLTDRSRTGVNYQITFSYYVPGDAQQIDSEPLSITLTYNETSLTVNETVRAIATVTNRREDPAPMVIVDLPIPSGFAVISDDFDQLVKDGTIAKYQLTPRSTIVYLRSLRPGESRVLGYRLRATMPVKVSVRGADAYEYYDPDVKASSRGVEFEAVRRD